MRKLFTVILLFIALGSNAQSVVLLLNDFNGYLGTTATVAPGWYYSWNDTSTKSFYTSAGNYGFTAPSYKFGRDSTTIITPRIMGSPDTLVFWMKGNGSGTNPFSINNSFSIFESPDSLNWTLNTVIDSMPIVGNGSTDSMRVLLQLNATTQFLKFYYHKVVGNVAFDDMIVIGTITAVPSKQVQNFPVLYPNPSRGFLNMDFRNTAAKNAVISISDLLGNELKRMSLKNNDLNCQLDLSDLQDGIYFVKVKSDAGESTRRIVLKK